MFKNQGVPAYKIAPLKIIPTSSRIGFGFTSNPDQTQL